MSDKLQESGVFYETLPPTITIIADEEQDVIIYNALYYKNPN